MNLLLFPENTENEIDPKIYGQFLEQFHRIIYEGIYDPENSLSDENGFREDVIQALREIKVSVLRWPGGCFASAYHWKDGIGETRSKTYDKAWRVTEPNTFGTNEFINFCREVGAEPYICTNAGTGTSEEMANWVEYCNLPIIGKWSTMRALSQQEYPYKVRYWSIGNENYNDWEIGSKSREEWGRFVCESAKMMIRTDPTIELSAAALTDANWNMSLLQKCAPKLKWISIHKYWDEIYNTNDYANYEEVMAYTSDLDEPIRKVRGMLEALGLEHSISIAFDEWNLRGWFHPNIFTEYQGIREDEYLEPRNKNDENQHYSMADTIFTACVLNMLFRNSDIVKMANYSPAVNVRGLIYTWKHGIVKRGTYYVYKLYVNQMGDKTLHDLCEGGCPQMNVLGKDGNNAIVDMVDIVSTIRSDGKIIAVSLVNKHLTKSCSFNIETLQNYKITLFRLSTVEGITTESYNDIDREEIRLKEGNWHRWDGKDLVISPASVNVLQLKWTKKL